MWGVGSRVWGVVSRGVGRVCVEGGGAWCSRVWGVVL